MQLTPFEHNIGDVGISTQKDADGQNKFFELKDLLLLEIQVNLAEVTLVNVPTLAFSGTLPIIDQILCNLYPVTPTHCLLIIDRY